MSILQSALLSLTDFGIYLIMCAASELRFRCDYLCVLVVGIVLITKGKKARILFIETNNLMHDTIYYLIIVIYYFWYFYVKKRYFRFR